jgi:hypothetical protein
VGIGHEGREWEVGNWELKKRERRIRTNEMG